MIRDAHKDAPEMTFWDELKKNLVNKIFGYLARCEILENVLYIDHKNWKLG